MKQQNNIVEVAYSPNTHEYKIADRTSSEKRHDKKNKKNQRTTRLEHE